MTQPTPASSRIADGVLADSSTGVSKHDCSPVPHVPDHELLRLIGAGAYGDVWLARNITGACRAIKIIYRRRFDDDRPFEREFNGIQRFEPISRSHPSQVAILHIGKNERDGYFYYVMELADDASDNTQNPQSDSPQNPAFSSRQPPGSIESYVPKTLKWELKTLGRLPFDQCLRISLSLTTALAHLHHHGLIHRDIKPSNIIFVGGLPKLADIGLVSWIDATRSFVGTEGFVPPEGAGSPEADIYSLGKVLYEICTGRDRQEFPELPTELREISDREELIELNEIILKACESDPRKRYQSAEEMHADLALLQAGKSVRRARGLEKHLRLLKRSALAALAVVAITTAAWFYQQRQTREARYWADQSRQRLARLYTTQGIQRIEEGDLLGSLPWIAEAFKLDQNSPAEETQRIRLGLILNQSPSLNLFWHRPEPFTLIDISPDQQTVLAANKDLAHLLDLQTGSPLGAPLKQDGNVLSASFSPQGDRILISTDRGVATVWDLKTRIALCTQKPAGLTLNFSIFSPDGQSIFTAAHDPAQGRHYAWAWNAHSGNALGPPLPANGVIRQMCLSSDGQHLAMESQPPLCPELTLWNLRTGQLLWTVGTYHDQANALRFSPNGRWLYSGYATGAVKRWDLLQGTNVHILDVNAAVLSLGFSHDHKRLAVGTGFDSGRSHGTAFVIDLTTEKPIGQPILHHRPVRTVAFSPDDRFLLTTSDDATIRIWLPKTGQLAFAPLPHEGELRQTAFSRGGRCLISITQHAVRLWDLNLANPTTQPLYDHDKMCLTAVSPDGRYAVSASAYHSAQLWDVASEKTIGPSLPHAAAITSFAFSNDNQFLAAGLLDKTVCVWHLPSGRMTGPVLPHPAPVERLIFHPDNRTLATVSGHTVHLWDPFSGQSLRPPISVPNPVQTLGWSAQNQTLIIACTHNHESQLFRAPLQAGPAVADPKRWPGRILGILSAQDQLQLAIAENNFTVRIWNDTTGSPVTPPLKQDGSAWHFTANSNFTKAAIGSNRGTLRLWNLPSGELIGPSLKNPSVGFQAGLGSDEQSLVVAGFDGTARVWNCAPDPRPASQLLALALALSTQEIDATGAALPASPARLAEAWAQSRPGRPPPTPSARMIADWHRRQAEECERERIWNPNSDQWEAAAFHRSRSLEIEPESAADWLARALDNLRLNRWDQARIDYQTALSLGAQIKALTSDLLMLQLVTGDTEAYQRSCLELLHPAQSTPNSSEINDAVWLSCLIPRTLPDYSIPIQRIRQLTELQPHANSFWNTLGAVLYRAGLHDQAVQALDQAKLCTPDKEGTPFDALFLAMAHHALGHTARAQDNLTKAIRSIQTPDPGRLWKWQLQLNLLRQQAESLILNGR